MSVATSIHNRSRSSRFLFYRAGAAQALTANTWEKILFPTKISDATNLLANSRLTASLLSRWQVTYHVPFDSAGAPSDISLAIAKNGVLDLQISQLLVPASTISALSGNVSVILSANDYVELWARRTVAGATTHSGIVYSWIQFAEMS